MMSEEPAIANEAPHDEVVTPYDEGHLVLYIRLLDAEAADADWATVARLLLQRDPNVDEPCAYRCWQSHLRRAHWLAEIGYKAVVTPGEGAS